MCVGTSVSLKCHLNCGEHAKSIPDDIDMHRDVVTGLRPRFQIGGQGKVFIAFTPRIETKGKNGRGTFIFYLKLWSNYLDAENK
jgi:hypothetical protein